MPWLGGLTRVAMAAGMALAGLPLTLVPPRAASAAGGECDAYPPPYDHPGVTWTDVSPRGGQGTDFYGIAFLDPLRGAVVGDMGMIFSTANGGATWTPGLLPAGHDPTHMRLSRIAFTTLSDGWTTGYDPGNTNKVQPATILHTSDGGVNWERQPVPSLVGLPAVDGYPSYTRFFIEGMWFLPGGEGAESGFVSAIAQGGGSDPDRAMLLRTTNGGRPKPDGTSGWELVEPQLVGPDGAVRRTVRLRDLRFIDGQTGYATSATVRSTGSEEATSSYGAILKTTDAGTTWRLIWQNPHPERVNHSEQGGFYRLVFSDDGRQGFASWFHSDDPVGDEIWATDDGGKTWFEQVSCNPMAPVRLAFSGGRNCPPDRPLCNGIAVGDAHNATFTKDAGRRWVPDRVPTPTPLFAKDLYSVARPSPVVAYATSRSDAPGGVVWKASITLVEVSGVTPNQGLMCGGSEVTIVGEDFADDSIVYFGDTQVAPDDVSFVDSSKLRVKVPRAAAPGTVQVAVETPGLGRSLPGENTTFTYLDPGQLPPVVDGLSQASGRVAGGDKVTISGERLDCAVSVSFRERTGTRSVTATVMKVVDGGIEVITPAWPHDPGEVQVVVSVAGLAATTVPSVASQPGRDVFEYLGLPSVSGVDGPGSALGGTDVTLTGTGFEGRATDGQAQVLIDGRAGEVVSVATDGRAMKVRVPPMAPGKAPGGDFQVTVSTDKRGTSLPFTGFAYHPGVRGIFPPSGLVTGGEGRTITGAGLRNAERVVMGGQEATIVDRSDDGTSLALTTPARSAPESVPVEVVVSGLASLETVFFTYGGAIVVDAGPGDPDTGVPPRQDPGSPNPAPPGGTGSPAPGASPSPSPAPSPSPGASASGAGSPGASGSHAQAPVGAAAGASGVVGAAAPGAAAAPAQAAAGPGHAGTGAAADQERSDARNAPHHNMTAANVAVGLGGAGAAMCFSWLALGRRRRASRSRTRPRGAY